MKNEQASSVHHVYGRGPLRYAVSLFIGLIMPVVMPGPALMHSGAPAIAATVPVCRTVIAPALVYALSGIVYRVGPNGRNLCLVSRSVGAREPRLSPGGARVAFLSGVGSYGDGHSQDNTVRVGDTGLLLGNDRSVTQYETQYQA